MLAIERAGSSEDSQQQLSGDEREEELVNYISKMSGLTRKQLIRDPFLWVLVTAIVIVRLVYIESYPFLIEGDGYDYFQLLDLSHSNLLHATGYIFFNLIPYRIAKLTVSDPASLLRFWQQLISIVAVIALYIGLRRIAPAWIALMVCGAIGLDAQMISAAGTTRPEFFQALILMLLVSALLLGLTATNLRAKACFYVAIGVFATAGYLTKYNSLPSFVVCLVPLFDSRLTRRSRYVILSSSITAGIVLYSAFLFTFHYPTTSSFYLNLEHGWIHILKMRDAGIPIVPENGISTQKYIILSEQLPRVAAGSGYWNSLREVPDSTRAPFRERWQPLLASTDAEYVRSAFGNLPAPELRRKGYYDPEAFCSVYYHLGLKETETLLGAVFREGVRAHFARYSAHVWEWFVNSVDFSKQYTTYLPVPSAFDPSFFEPSSRGFFSQRSPVLKTTGLMRHEDLAAQIWYPGAALLSPFVLLKTIPAEVIWGAILAAFVPLANSVILTRRIGTAELVFIFLLLVLLAEMSFSALVYAFRMKELILCQPLIYCLLGLSLLLWRDMLSKSERGKHDKFGA